MRRLLALGVLTIWLVPAASPTSAEQAAAGRAGSGTPQKPAPAPASTAMTNADVVKLVKAGLGDDIIVSAIRSSKERKFKLDADGLVQLKSDGVPDRVIAVMLNPDAAPHHTCTRAGPGPAARDSGGRASSHTLDRWSAASVPRRRSPRCRSSRATAQIP